MTRFDDLPLAFAPVGTHGAVPANVGLSSIANVLARIQETAVTVMVAIVEGNAASHRYEHLRVKGVPHAEAVTQIWTPDVR